MGPNREKVMISIQRLLNRISACPESRAWCRKNKVGCKGGMSLAKAYKTCPDGTWLAYLFVEIFYDLDAKTQAQIGNWVSYIDHMLCNTLDLELGWKPHYLQHPILTSEELADAIREIVPWSEARRILEKVK